MSRWKSRAEVVVGQGLLLLMDRGCYVWKPDVRKAYDQRLGEMGEKGLAWVREICTVAELLLFCIGCWPHSGERDWTSVLEIMA